MNGQRVAGLVVGALVAAAASLIEVAAPSVNAAAFVVNDTRDRVDSRPGNGVCRTSDGRCTLRAAIQEANASAGPDVITLGAGTYRLTRAPLNANDITTGDLDITGSLAINGAGAGTIVDGGTPPAGSPPERTALDRLFEIHETAGNVTLSAMAIAEGWESKEGGALLTRSPGTTRLVDVDVLRSVAGTAGGGIYYDGFAGGTLIIERSTIAGNSTTGEGGGIYMASGRLIVSGAALDRSSISGNSARNGGGLYHAGALTENGRRSEVELSATTVTGNAALQDGGGIENGLEGDLRLTDVTVSANRAGGEGGGVASVFKTSLTATGATFTANEAESEGGGVFADSSGPVAIVDSKFAGNSAGGSSADGSDDGGGGLSVYGAGTVGVAGSTFLANRASGEGGGIAIHSDGSVDVADTSVTENVSGASGGGILASGRVVNFTRLDVSANRAVGLGGGIDNQGSGEFAIVDSTVASNFAADGGGMANRADSTLRVTGSTFWDNHATTTGGGLLHRSDAATEIENTTMSGNFAGFNGGGLYLDADAGLHVVNTTITQNEAFHGSGVGTPDAIDNFPIVSHPLLVFRNTIVAGNVGGPDCHAAFGSEGGNLDGGRLCNFSGPRDRTNINPLLDKELRDNGGPTRTHAVLTASSPAVGGGVEPCPVNDQRGVQRETDRRCDSGSYEFEGTPEAPGSDLDSPETTLSSGPSDTTESNEATFAFSSNDGEATFECSLDGADFEVCVSPVHYAELAGGRHTFDVQATDAAGNTDPTPASFTWTIEQPPDATPPETRIESGPDAVTGSRVATFTFAANELDASFECSLDGVSFEGCASPAGHAGLQAGLHTFAVRALDVAGNQDPTAATWTWTVVPPPDTVAPHTMFTSTPNATTESPDATFVFSSDEPGSTFTCALDGTSFNTCVSPYELDGLSIATHTFQVRATDPAGNVEIGPATHTWTIVVPLDRTPPETTLASGPASPTEITSALFTFAASETGSTFECALDEAAFETCSSPAEYTGLSASDHTFKVQAVDVAGNVDPTPESFTWTIEAPPPPAAIEITINSGPPTPTASTSATFTFSANVPGASFACSLDGADFAACTSGIELGGLATGEHTFDVQASDAAGNSDTARHAWTIEACGAPVTVIADADAWIDENSSATNKGADSILKLSTKAPHDDFRVLVRFPVPDSIPAGCRIMSATMSLYAASSTPDRILEALRLGQAWTENGVMWDKQPSPVGDSAVVTSGRGYRDWNVTPHVQAIYDGAVNHGFLIRDSELSGGGFEQQFHSREKGENPPTLVITLAPAGG